VEHEYFLCFGQVALQELVPGLSKVYSSHTSAPNRSSWWRLGADPSRLQFPTRNRIAAIDESGALVFKMAPMAAARNAPRLSEIAGVARAVEGLSRISGQVVSFQVGRYDRSLPLRSIRWLSYARILGALAPKATAIAVGRRNFAYVTGYTDSTTGLPRDGGVLSHHFGRRA